MCEIQHVDYFQENCFKIISWEKPNKSLLPAKQRSLPLKKSKLMSLEFFEERRDKIPHQKVAKKFALIEDCQYHFISTGL